MTATMTFAIAWTINSVHKVGVKAMGYQRFCFTSIILSLGALGLYHHFRRQWLKYLRSEVVRNASVLVSNAQNFDTAASSAITFVQEVELVSRGYRMYV